MGPRRAVGAGFLIAAMVWLLPGAEATQFHVIVLMTWLISVAGFVHVVAGSIEAFMLLLNGQMGVWPMLADFFAPVLIGNVIGGTALFALIAYAQVMQEIRPRQLTGRQHRPRMPGSRAAGRARCRPRWPRRRPRP